jgi:predicted AAA+ superfamily ATPase
VDTARRWVDLLVRLHYGFLVRPWFSNVSKSLRKEPKWFLRDWSGIEDRGARAETFIACHLLKAVEGWTDLGLGQFELRYLRDKLKRESCLTSLSKTLIVLSAPILLSYPRGLF